MTDERWGEIKGMVKDKFGVDQESTQDLPAEEGGGVIEIIEFTGPLGRMRLTRTTQPLVTGKKVLGSRRIGSESTVQYQYSETETVNKFTVYKYNSAIDNWEAMEMERGEMIF